MQNTIVFFCLLFLTACNSTTNKPAVKKNIPQRDTIQRFYEMPESPFTPRDIPCEDSSYMFCEIEYTKHWKSIYQLDSLPIKLVLYSASRGHEPAAPKDKISNRYHPYIELKNKRFYLKNDFAYYSKHGIGFNWHPYFSYFDFKKKRYYLLHLEERCGACHRADECFFLIDLETIKIYSIPTRYDYVLDDFDEDGNLDILPDKRYDRESRSADTAYVYSIIDNELVKQDYFLCTENSVVVLERSNWYEHIPLEMIPLEPIRMRLLPPAFGLELVIPRE